MYKYNYRNGYLIYDRDTNKVSFTDVFTDNDLTKTICKDTFLDSLKEKDSNGTNFKEVQITYISTSFCNLNCKYCYEHNNIVNKPMLSMSADQHYEIYTSVKNKFPTSKIKICFFGGEPFIAKSSILSFIDKLVYDHQSNDTQFPALSAITNGTLLDIDTLKYIHEYFVGVTFSLDGTKILHDANRIYKDGHGSFDDIVENIKQMNELNYDKKVKLSCEVTLTDAYAINYTPTLIKEVLLLLKSLNLDTADFITVMDDDSKYINSLETLDLIAKDIVEFWYEDLIANKTPIYIPTLMSYLFLLIGNKTISSKSCAAGKSYFAVDSNYDIYPCQVSAFQDSSIIGKISDSTFTLTNSEESPYKEKYEYPFCKECECLKGCNRFCKIVMNNATTELPTSCLFSKQLFKHSLIKIVDLLNSDKKDAFIKGVKNFISLKDINYEKSF